MELTDNPGLARGIMKGTAFLGLYGWASYVGYSRIRDSKHYLTDVIVGAAVGTVISNLLYTLHFASEEEDGDSAHGLTFGIAPGTGGGIGLAVRF